MKKNTLGEVYRQRLVKNVNLSIIIFFRKVYIYKYISRYMARKIVVKNGRFNLSEKIEKLFEKIVTPFGTGAKIDAPKELIGKRVYVLVVED